MTKRIFKK